MLDQLSTSVPPDYYDHNDSVQNCFLCGAPSYQVYQKSHDFGLPLVFQQCRCGLIKQTPLPNERFFNWFFNAPVFYSAAHARNARIWGYQDYFGDERSRMATARLRYKKLSVYFPRQSGLRILKIGPATGTFLKVANDHGHHAIGCDISSEFVAFARSRYDVRIDHGRFEKMRYESEQFDIVVLFNVIENIPNQDEIWSEIQRVLKPNGIFMFNYVDMQSNIIAKLQGSRYFLFRPPVCYAFSASLIERLLGRFGFEPIVTKRDTRYMTLEKILTLLRLNYLARLFQRIGIAKLPFPIFAYPSRIVVARKHTA